MPKPSDRIIEIRNSMNGFLAPEIIAQAIMKYLDEQYEKNKPCKHKSSYQVQDQSAPNIYYNVCNDCGVLFLSSLPTEDKG